MFRKGTIARALTQKWAEHAEEEEGIAADENETASLVKHVQDSLSDGDDDSFEQLRGIVQPLYTGLGKCKKPNACTHRSLILELYDNIGRIDKERKLLTRQVTDLEHDSLNAQLERTLISGDDFGSSSDENEAEHMSAKSQTANISNPPCCASGNGSPSNSLENLGGLSEPSGCSGSLFQPVAPSAIGQASPRDEFGSSSDENESEHMSVKSQTANISNPPCCASGNSSPSNSLENLGKLSEPSGCSGSPFQPVAPLLSTSAIGQPPHRDEFGSSGEENESEHISVKSQTVKISNPSSCASGKSSPSTSVENLGRLSEPSGCSSSHLQPVEPLLSISAIGQPPPCDEFGSSSEENESEHISVKSQTAEIYNPPGCASGNGSPSNSLENLRKLSELSGCSGSPFQPAAPLVPISAIVQPPPRETQLIRRSGSKVDGQRIGAVRRGIAKPRSRADGEPSIALGVCTPLGFGLGTEVLGQGVGSSSPPSPSRRSSTVKTLPEGAPHGLRRGSTTSKAVKDITQLAKNLDLTPTASQDIGEPATHLELAPMCLSSGSRSAQLPLEAPEAAEPPSTMPGREYMRSTRSSIVSLHEAELTLSSIVAKAFGDCVSARLAQQHAAATFEQKLRTLFSELSDELRDAAEEEGFLLQPRAGVGSALPCLDPKTIGTKSVGRKTLLVQSKAPVDRRSSLQAPVFHSAPVVRSISKQAPVPNLMLEGRRHSAQPGSSSGQDIWDLAATSTTVTSLAPKMGHGDVPQEANEPQHVVQAPQTKPGGVFRFAEAARAVKTMKRVSKLMAIGLGGLGLKRQNGNHEDGETEDQKTLPSDAAAAKVVEPAKDEVIADQKALPKDAAAAKTLEQQADNPVTAVRYLFESGVASHPAGWFKSAQAPAEDASTTFGPISAVAASRTAASAGSACEGDEGSEHPVPPPSSPPLTASSRGDRAPAALEAPPTEALVPVPVDRHLEPAVFFSSGKDERSKLLGRRGRAAVDETQLHGFLMKDLKTQRRPRVAALQPIHPLVVPQSASARAQTPRFRTTQRADDRKVFKEDLARSMLQKLHVRKVKSTRVDVIVDDCNSLQRLCKSPGFTERSANGGLQTAHTLRTSCAHPGPIGVVKRLPRKNAPCFGSMEIRLWGWELDDMWASNNTTSLVPEVPDVGYTDYHVQEGHARSRWLLNVDSGGLQEAVDDLDVDLSEFDLYRGE